jgi:hypothetical protein
MSEETDSNSTWLRAKKGVLALCLVSMVAGFVTFGALGYQAWKLFHNPFLAEEQIAGSPSPEAAPWAAGVYREEKRDHLFYTGLFEAGLIVLATGSWLAYRALDKRVQNYLGQRFRNARGPGR